jgi:hypothetical protein
MSQKYTDVCDYSEGKLDNTHYNGVPSMYGKLCKKQQDQQPDYCWPGDVGDGGMHGEHRNEQKGP